jgi:hypothetical protein
MTIRCSSVLLLGLLLASPEPAYGAKDNTKIVAIARHTFRGINKTIGPQKLSLKDYGIDLKSLPILSWAEDSTSRGQEIARDHASVGLQKAAAQAIQALGENKTFDGHWDEIRADLSTERTFWTALRIREGLKGTIPVTGCPTQGGEPVDVVTTRGPVMKCVNEAIGSLMSASPDLRIFKQRGMDFLQAVRSAINQKDSLEELPEVTLDQDGKLPKIYSELANLASALEMVAELGAPLDEIFPGSNRKMGRQVIESGMNFLGIRFFIKNPIPASDIVSDYMLQYMAERKEGTHSLLLTHDDSISNLLHSLNIINSTSDPDELAIYPIETIVFAFGEKHVSIVRMRIRVNDPDGFMPGSFGSKVIWKGTRAEWDKKVQDIRARAAAWKVSPTVRTCLDDLSKNVCEAEVLDVRYLPK